MPVQFSSFLLPRNGNTWFLLEDKYLKGGFQVCADTAARNAINPANLKAGQLVVTQNDNRLWQLQADLITWLEFNPAVTPPPSPLYTHKQAIPQATWTVAHGKACSYFSYTIFDDSGKAVLPNEVTIVDTNNVVLSFLVPIGGHCVFAFDFSAQAPVA